MGKPGAEKMGKKLDCAQPKALWCGSHSVVCQS